MKKIIISIVIILGIIAYAVIGAYNTQKHAFIMKLGYYPKAQKVTEIKWVDDFTYNVVEKTIYVKPQ